MYSREEIAHLITIHNNTGSIPTKFKIVEDATDYYAMDYGDVLILNGIPYLIRNCCKEGRFGIDDQDKFWVRRAIDLTNGGLKVIKLVFHETFNLIIGELMVEFMRSPRKESRVLNKVKGHKNFMQGIEAKDTAGNIIRVADFIKGRSWYDLVPEQGKGHEEYYYNIYPHLFLEFVELVSAIAFLHSRGEIHGDIRSDHILKENETGINKWIDFDYGYVVHGESHFGYDVFCLGNVLNYITGRGEVTVQNIHKKNPALDLKSMVLTGNDLHATFKNRIVNLKKVYPYISEKINKILLHFSIGSDEFYDSTGWIIEDLMEAYNALQKR